MPGAACACASMAERPPDPIESKGQSAAVLPLIAQPPRLRLPQPPGGILQGKKLRLAQFDDWRLHGRTILEDRHPTAVRLRKLATLKPMGLSSRRYLRSERLLPVQFDYLDRIGRHGVIQSLPLDCESRLHRRDALGVGDRIRRQVGLRVQRFDTRRPRSGA